MNKKNRILDWLSTYKWELLFLCFLLLLNPLRGYWTPDEPDFAQCIKEMRAQGTWLFPWLDGEIYTEKPILFYWLMKIAAITMEWISGGLGFARGIAPWALRLPSIIAAAGFVFAFRAWARRFLDDETGRSATFVLVTSPLWVWQAQFIQIDMVFAVLLAGSWLSWISGYALLRGLTIECRAGECRRWFLASYTMLGLAVLAKGPLALVLSTGVMLCFLAWQRDFLALRRTSPGLGLMLFLCIVLPWYLVAGIKGGAAYVKAMLIHQNVSRALAAWDHIQPWWRYLSYLAIDFMPWSLLLPLAVWKLVKIKNKLSPIQRFVVLAWLVPLVLLSCSKSKQGKYLLMCYPFFAISIVQAWNQINSKVILRMRRIVGSFFAVIGLATLFIALAGLGGTKLQSQVQPFSKFASFVAIVLLFGGIWLGFKGRWQSSRMLIKYTASLMAVMCLVVLPQVFIHLDPIKDYREWARKTEPLLKDHHVYFWGEIRSGAMIYSDILMPVISDVSQMNRLKPGDRMVATRRRWRAGLGGLNDETRRRFQVIYEQNQGGDGLLLLEARDPSPDQ